MNELIAQSLISWQTMFEAMEDIVSIHAPDYTILEVNNAFAHHFNKLKTELVGHKCYELFHGTQCAHHECPFNTMMQTKQSAFLELYEPLLNKWIEISLTPIFKEDREIAGFVHVVRDVTKRKEYEQSLHAVQQKLESAISRTNLLAAKAEIAQEAKTNFLANISHELRTPLNGILGIADLLAATVLSAEQEEYVDIISRSGRSLLSLVNDILDFSKIEAGKLDLESISFDIRKLINQTVELISVAAHDKNLTVSVNVDSALPTELCGDPLRTGQIILNLVNNAVKFTHQGSIHVEASMHKELEHKIELMVKISDTGIGIPADRLNQLFKPFSQVDVSTTRNYGGTGLGLAICKKLVVMMEGTIGVESQENVGTVFSFTIQLSRHNNHSVEHVQHTPQATITHVDIYQRFRARISKRVALLLVEDNEVNRIACCHILKRFGISVQTACNGIEALQKMREARFNLVLMDIQMPLMDGFETVQAMRKGEAGEYYKNIPVVALTAHAFSDDKQRCIDGGMNGYVSKPIIAEQLAKVLLPYVSNCQPGDSSDGLGAGESQPLWNQELLLERVEGDRALLKQILFAFATTIPADIVQLKQALAEADVELVLQLVHKIKGACLNICAQPMVAIARTIEQTAEQKGVGALQALIDELEGGCKRISDSVMDGESVVPIQ
jgi:PAS domain S-box-containing protein